ncbi:MAG: hypothetical protein MUF83_16285 [Acidimicrobiales bacterium]|nr:hypothetical protein [Acidimicrobiales bacterium]
MIGHPTGRARPRDGRPAAEVRRTRRGGILSAMGMNPFRPQKRSPADYVMVVAALVICALLVGWALFGG